MTTGVRYGLDADHWIGPNDPIWNEALPVGMFSDASGPGDSPTYGELMLHVEAFVNRLFEDGPIHFWKPHRHCKNSLKPVLTSPRRFVW